MYIKTKLLWGFMLERVQELHILVIIPQSWTCNGYVQYGMVTISKDKHNQSVTIVGIYRWVYEESVLLWVVSPFLPTPQW